MIKSYDFVLQAHFRRKSVHFDIRFQHPIYNKTFFGYTIFCDTGHLDDDNISVETIDLGEKVINEWNRYFKPWTYKNKRMGIKKSMGPITWLKVDGLLPKHLKDTTYEQVMLILNYGKYYIYEDRLYSMKIAFDKVKTKHNAPDLLSDKTFIFRYLMLDRISDKRKSPFYIMTWPLKTVDFSSSTYEYIDNVTDTFDIYETTAGEIMGHYLMKDSKNNWYTVDRDPTLSTSFIYVKGKYELTDTKKIDTIKMNFDVLKSNKEDDYYVAIIGNIT